MRFPRLLCLAGPLLLSSWSAASFAQAVTPTEGPYKIVKSEKVGGAGGFDYVFCDADGRRLYIPRGNRVDVYNADTLKSDGSITPANGVHGAVVDTKTGHGFSSSRPVVMWDTKTLATLKTIDVQGGPDGIFADAATGHIFVLSHSQPNVTVLNASDGSLAGTIDLGGAPEQGCSDGKGHLFICVEDKNNIAAVDAATLKVTAHFDLGDQGGTPAGLAVDSKNNILFAYCRGHQTAVIMNAADGKILKILPTGAGVDAAAFNPDTMEAFSSHGDGILTVIKENSPADFAVEQQVQTRQGAKTCSLDAKTGHVLLITADRAAPAPAAAPPAGAPAGRAGRGGRGAMVPDSFTILVVGK